MEIRIDEFGNNHFRLNKKLDRFYAIVPFSLPMPTKKIPITPEVKKEKKFDDWIEYVGRQNAIMWTHEFTMMHLSDFAKHLQYVSQEHAASHKLVTEEDIMELSKAAMRKLIMERFQEFMDFVTERTLKST